jgi:hypothetical protein
MQLKKSVILFLLVTASLSLTGFSPAQQSGVSVSGQVSNGTPGANLPQAATLFLQFYNGSQVGSEYSTEMDPDGSFSFTGLDSEVGSSFVVFTEYLGVFYNSVESQLLSADNPNIDLVIYETTDDPADIVISNLYLLIYPGENTYQITEVYKVENSGRRTYVGKLNSANVRTTFDWTPPAGAQNILFSEAESRERYIANGQGYSDTYPIRPEPYYQEMDIAYDLPYTEQLTYSNRFEYPIQQMFVSGNLTDILISGGNFTEGQVAEDQDYLNGMYASGPYAANEEVTFTIQYSPNAHPQAGPTVSEPPSGLSFSPISFTLGMVALALAIFLGVMLLRQPNLPACPADIQPNVEKLAQLERQFAQAQIDKQGYAAQKKKLLAAIRRQTDKFLSHRR